MVTKLKDWWVLIVIILGCIIYYIFFNYLAFIKSDYICGTFIRTTTTKGASHYMYSFNYKGKKIYGTHSVYYFKKSINEDSLKKIDCLKIEYSFLSAEINRVADKRVLK